MKRPLNELQSIGRLVDRCAGSHIAASFSEMMADLTIYEATRLSQVLESVYRQGQKDALEVMKNAIAESKRVTLTEKYGRRSKRR